MNRSLRLLRPLGHVRPSPLSARGLSLSLARAPSALKPSAAAPIVAASAPSMPRAFPAMAIRLYVAPSVPVRADKSDKDHTAPSLPAKPKENPNADEQNATSGAVEEVRAILHDVTDMITGKAGHDYRATGGAVEALNPGAKGGVKAAQESSSHNHGGSITDDFVSVTKGLMQIIPDHVAKFGLLGTVPYITTSAGIVFLAREASRAAEGENVLTGMDYQTITSYLHTLEEVQITYGAVILSFLGALHWGMEFVGYGGEQGYRRLIVGTIPLVLAWPTVFLSHGVALACQWSAFTFTWFLDQRASTNGWTPSWFATYRFYLSIIVGFSIIGTLAGTSHYGMGAGSGMDPTTGKLKTLDDHVNARRKRQGMNSLADVAFSSKADRQPTDAEGRRSGVIRGKATGDFYIEEEEGLEAYGRLKKKGGEEEEEEEEEEEGEGGGAAADEGEDEGEGEKDEAKEDGAEDSGEDNEGGDGRSQKKKDDPDNKPAAGEGEPTGKR